MAEKEEKVEGQRRAPSLVWPVILIAAGALFLLSNLNVLQVDFWELWRLWPVLLILAGLDIVLGRRSALGNVIVLLVTVAVVVGVVFLLIASPEVLSPSAVGVTSVLEPRDGIEQADLEVNFAAGRLDIQRLVDSVSLIEGELELETDRQPIWEIDRSGARASMKLGYRQGGWMQSWQRGDQWELRLSPQVGLSLDVDVGAGDASLDLTGLDLRDLKVATGAGRSTIILPDEGDYTVKVSGGVGQVVVEIPEEIAARVKLTRAIGGTSVSDHLDYQGDGIYVTENWDTGKNRVSVDIEVGIGEVIVRVR